MNKFFLVFLLLLLQQVGTAQKALSFNVMSEDKDSFGIVEIRKGGYKFISPLLDCYSVTDPGLMTIKNMKQQLTDYIAAVKANGKADHISVYYRDLSNGPWMGIEEKELYSPASLLKVPILIAAMKYAETRPDFPSLVVDYFAPADTPQDKSNGNFLVPGNSYTVRQLLEYMIISSDNEAKYILSQIIPREVLTAVYEDLGIDVNKESQTDEFLSVKEYAGFFRILYNASYLNKASSEFALSILVESTYKKGIVAGLPSGVTVAHKFGERALINGTNLRQLHDCGIVYLNNRPYLLCVMTRGKEFTDLQDIISNISKIVYNVLNNGM